MKYLKNVRVVLSVIMFTVICITFLDYYRIFPAYFKNFTVFLQFIPSLLSFTISASITGIGFAVILLITALFGRVYCSFICPLGFCQDIFIRLGKQLRKSRKSGCSAPHNVLFYSILAICIVSFFISGTALILWLDPFSIFGRFMTFGASRIFFFFNNNVASFLIEKNIFTVNSFSITPSGAGAVFALIFFTVIMTLSFIKGRLYCNSVCPAGALLSLVSRISLFKLNIDKSTCIRCGRCERSCKSSCIDYNGLNVDFSRCVACYNCISQCPKGSINYIPRFSQLPENSSKQENKAETTEAGRITRSSFISGLLLVPSALIAQKKNGVLYFQDSSKQVVFKRKQFSSPPGSTSVELFNSRCTACSLCISACPTTVLQPAVLQYGLAGIMQPFMDFDKGYCNYECVLCSEICPADAIRKVGAEEKKLIQTGKSMFIKENCITYTNGTDCGACSEHCPTKAVNMVPFKNRLVIPEVNTEICTGCGACEHVCPVRPNKAIYVDGNPVHLTAKPPAIKEQKKKTVDVFPF